MKILTEKKHNKFYNFFNRSIALDKQEIYRDTMEKIINYYSNLDFSKIDSFEYSFFEHTLFSTSFIKELLKYHLIVEKMDDYGLKESLREFHIPPVFTNEELQYEICYYFNLWVIKRLGYKLNTKKYPFEKPDIEELENQYLNRYITVREAMLVLSKIGAGQKYEHSNIYEEYLNLYLEYPVRNLANITNSLTKSENSYIKHYAKDITKRILKLKEVS